MPANLSKSPQDSITQLIIQIPTDPMEFKNGFVGSVGCFEDLNESYFLILVWLLTMANLFFNFKNGFST